MIRLTAALCVLMALPALAQEALPDDREARKMLFGTRGSEGAVMQIEGLSDADKDILGRVAITQKYYGAIAFSPDEGLLSEATVAAANHHSVAPAKEAALAECNAKRASGSAKCVIGAEILPRKYEADRPLQLSMDATFAFGKDYRRAKDPKAFAISPDLGHWGVGDSDAAALDACAELGAKDCEIVIRN